MSKFIRETRARIADAYGNRFIKDRVFHCICTFMRFIDKLRVNYGFRQDNKGPKQHVFIDKGGRCEFDASEGTDGSSNVNVIGGIERG